jgi:hypothetical protein
MFVINSIVVVVYVIILQLGIFSLFVFTFDVLLYSLTDLKCFLWARHWSPHWNESDTILGIRKFTNHGGRLIKKDGS